MSRHPPYSAQSLSTGARAPDNLVDRGDGVRTGTTPDGRKINVRPTNSDGRPTVEIQYGKNREKFKYGDPPPPEEKMLSNFLQLKGPWDRMSPFQISSIVDDKNGLTIMIEDNWNGTLKGRFRFGAHHAYRNFNESDLNGYWKDLGSVLTTGLYVASDTELMKWAAKQAIDGNLHEDIKHYLVVSVEDVLEVLSFEPPEFEANSES